jgi:hypothetical protein
MGRRFLSRLHPVFGLRIGGRAERAVLVVPAERHANILQPYDAFPILYNVDAEFKRN